MATKKITFQKNYKARYQWLRPAIPATQEAEIRRIVVQSQLWANSSQDPISKKPITKKGLVERLKPQYHTQTHTHKP
jgi:hypothetical protein